MASIWDLLTWLAGAEPGRAAAEPGRERGDELVNCRACGAEAVVPVEWQAEGDEWQIALRCGACGGRRDVTLDDEQAREFDRALDRGAHRIARMLGTLERQRMLTDVESLSTALERDLIGADDFAAWRPTR